MRIRCWRAIGWFSLLTIFGSACGEDQGFPFGVETVGEPQSGAYLPIWQMPYEVGGTYASSSRAQNLAENPPIAPIARPDWGELEGTLLRWPLSWPEMKSTYLDMLPHLQDEGKVLIAVESVRGGIDEAMSDIEDCAACRLDEIEWVGLRTDSIWMRDYGPQFIETQTEAQAVVDLDYYADRRQDDDFPSAFAQEFDLPSYGPGLELAGGNFQVDGAGACFVSWAAAESNTEERVRETLTDYFGCEQIVFMDYLVEESTHHIDMWMKFVSPQTVLVGDYSYRGDEILAYPDTVNEGILDSVAGKLVGLGYQVVRIPQPASIWYEPFATFTIRTYTNSSFANQTILIPVYGDPTDATALAIYDQVLPTEVNEVGIDSSYIINFGGAMHCITMEKHAPSQTINTDPVAALSPDRQRVDDGVAALFDASASFDADGDQLSFHWQWGDGSPIEISSDPKASHVYSDRGNYTCQLTVSDSVSSDSVSVTVMVR